MNILFIIKVKILVSLNGYVGHPIMLTIESRMIIIFWTRILVSYKHVFYKSVFGATPNHIPINYRRLIKISNWIRHVFLSADGCWWDERRMRNIGWPVALRSELRSFLQVFTTSVRRSRVFSNFAQKVSRERRRKFSEPSCVVCCRVGHLFHLIGGYRFSLFCLQSFLTNVSVHKLVWNSSSSGRLMEGKRNFPLRWWIWLRFLPRSIRFLCRRRGSWRKIGSSWINFVAQTVIQLWSRLCGRWSSLQFHCSSFWLLIDFEFQENWVSKRIVSFFWLLNGNLCTNLWLLATPYQPLKVREADPIWASRCRVIWRRFKISIRD